MEIEKRTGDVMMCCLEKYEVLILELHYVS
jgi:hypothetical protein